jgi:hypothetical protein
VAYIISDEPASVSKSSAAAVTAAPRSRLSRGTFDQQLDVYRLAKSERGHGRMRRLWNEFAEDSPGIARLVASYDAMERQADAVARDELDDLLAKAAASPAPAVPAEPAWLTSLRNSPDPAQREAAWRIEARRYGAA